MASAQALVERNLQSHWRQFPVPSKLGDNPSSTPDIASNHLGGLHQDFSFSADRNTGAKRVDARHQTPIASSLQTDFVRCPYSTSEMLLVRNALKFGAKVFKGSEIIPDPDNRLSVHAHNAEVGLLLALGRANAEVIAAGLLYNIDLNQVSPSGDTTAAEVIERKFGARVLELVKTAQNFVSDPNVGPIDKDIASLCSAISSARRSIGLDVALDVSSQVKWYQQSNVPRGILSQFYIDFGMTVPKGWEVEQGEIWSPAEAVNMRNALRAASILFRDVERQWGPSELLPLSAHQAEVGLIAALGGCSANVVTAAPLHDLFENYISLPLDYLEEQVAKFGPEVQRLVSAVTEPPKLILADGTESLENWFTRKFSVLKNVLGGDQELAELSACTKISTLAAGNVMLWRGGTLEDWSKGTADANVEVFIRHAEAFHAAGINLGLEEQYGMELERFILILNSSRSGGRLEHGNDDLDAAELSADVSEGSDIFEMSLARESFGHRPVA